jgi:undecaprenyl-diphosphatase
MNLLVIFFAKYFIYLILLTLITSFFFMPTQAKKKIFLLALISLPLSFIVARIASHYYYNIRPFVIGNFVPLISHAADNGFPSDHTLLLATLAAVFFPFAKRASFILWLSAIVVGLARVAAGVHHAFDITGSIAISILITTVVYFFLKRLRKNPVQDLELPIA